MVFKFQTVSLSRIFFSSLILVFLSFHKLVNRFFGFNRKCKVKAFDVITGKRKLYLKYFILVNGK